MPTRVNVPRVISVLSSIYRARNDLAIDWTNGQFGRRRGTRVLLSVSGVNDANTRLRDSTFCAVNSSRHKKLFALTSTTCDARISGGASHSEWAVNDVDVKRPADHVQVWREGRHVNQLDTVDSCWPHRTPGGVHLTTTTVWRCLPQSTVYRYHRGHCHRSITQCAHDGDIAKKKHANCRSAEFSGETFR